MSEPKRPRIVIRSKKQDEDLGLAALGSPTGSPPKSVDPGKVVGVVVVVGVMVVGVVVVGVVIVGASGGVGIAGGVIIL